MENKGTLVSCDLYNHKVGLIGEGASRLGVLNLLAICQDAGEFNPEWEEKADLVLADLPCSGIGIIRKKPDIRYKSEEEIEGLPELQLKLLANLCRYVKPGGRLLYSTCTLIDEENEGVVSLFLKCHPDFSPDPFMLPGIGEVKDGRITLWPSLHGTDGFFICRMRKRSAI
jgi:16S rRNA (cytosine967-C5)-methyltransferase